jgi:hypothetical protein
VAVRGSTTGTAFRVAVDADGAWSVYRVQMDTDSCFIWDVWEATFGTESEAEKFVRHRLTASDARGAGTPGGLR